MNCKYYRDFPITPYKDWVLGSFHIKGLASGVRSRLPQFAQGTWEQQELFQRIMSQPMENPDQVGPDGAIDTMRKMQEIKLPF